MGNIEGYPLRKIDFSEGEKRLLFAGLLLHAPAKLSFGTSSSVQTITVKPGQAFPSLTN